MAMVLDAVTGLIALLFFGIVFYGPWQRVCTDFSRQILFEARDEIFDLALQGKIQFDSDEYRTIRHSIEQTIRYAHELTWPRLAYELMARKLLARRGPSQLYRAIERIEDENLRSEIKDRVRRALSVSVASMLLKSLPGIVLILPLLTIFTMGYLFRRTLYANDWAHRVRELVQCDAELNEIGPRPL
jgi:hypothetical protein